MNRIDNSKENERAGELAAAESSRRERYLISVAMLAYPALIALAYGPVGGGFAMAAATMAYALSIVTHYGVARLAYTGHNYLLWGCGVLAFIVGYAISGLDALWLILSSWSLILFAGAVVGRLSAAGRDQLRVYLAGLVVTLCFAMVLYYPQFEAMMSFFASEGSKLIEQTGEGFVAMGFGADAVRHNLESVERMLSAFVRLVPTMMILSAVVPFSVGYLWFAYRISRSSYPGKSVAPFMRWKMPVGFIPVLIVASLMRFLGNDAVQLVADNILAFVGFFYLVTGLAVMDFYFRIYLPNFLRWTFYAAFFLFQFSGTIVALALLLAVIVLGFLDSFFNWRKSQRLSLREK